MRLSRPFLLCLLEVLVCCAPVQAADWLTVASDRVRRVELDRASIMPSDAGTKVAWGRIVLSNDQAKAYGYRTVRALNRYDCRSHAFIIVKRVYLSDDESVLREDKVDATIPITVKSGTVDDRFFNEVCKPPSVADLRNTAKQAAEQIAKTEESIKESINNRATPGKIEKGTKDTKDDRSDKLDNGRPILRRADIRLATDEPPAPPVPKALEKTPPKSIEKAPLKASQAPVPLAKAEPARKATAEAPPAHASTPVAEKRAVPERTAERPASSGSIAMLATNSSAPSPVHRAQRDTEQRAAENAATRAAQQIAAMVAHKETAPAYADPARKPLATMAATSSSKPVAPVSSDAHDLHWSYEGSDGPENWGKLDPEFSVCNNGKRQSPIDIRDGIKVDQEPIQFDYSPTYFRIIDNGHTIQVSYGAGSHISVMGRTYELVQFHFHHPAEERIDGKGFAMVAHLVHRDAEGRLAVVAVLLEAGQANRFIQTLWNNLPLEKNEDYAARVAIQAADLLPARRDYISYVGSLTTPPCTEGVLWLVMKEPVQLSAEQIDVFSRFYPNNARPVQAAAGRVIKESR